MPSESSFMFANKRDAIPQRHGSHRIAYIESLEGSATDDKTTQGGEEAFDTIWSDQEAMQGTTGKTKSWETHCSCPQTNSLAQSIARHRWENGHACLSWMP
jgi:hypothetical protein